MSAEARQVAAHEDPAGPVIAATDITVDVGAKRLFSGVSLQASAGSIIGIVGPSGSGKSSLGKVLCRLFPTETGNVRINGIDLMRLDAMNVPVMVWQEPCLFEHLSIRENIALGLTIRGTPEPQRSQIIDRFVDRFALKSLERSDVRVLSGGEKAKVGLSRALAVDPDVLILDEPFASLDVRSRDHAAQVITEFVRRPRKAAILISHAMNDITALCEEVLVLDSVVPKAQIPTEDIAEQPRSGFEAQISGTWHVLGAEVAAAEGSCLRCTTALGDILARRAPWVPPDVLKVGSTAAIIFEHSMSGGPAAAAGSISRTKKDGLLGGAGGPWLRQYLSEAPMDGILGLVVPE